MKKFESKQKLESFIRTHIPVMVKNKNGKWVPIFGTNAGFQTVIEGLADKLWEE